MATDGHLARRGHGQTPHGHLSTIDGGEGKREDAPLIGDNNERERELKGSEINVLFCGSALLVLVFDL